MFRGVQAGPHFGLHVVEQRQSLRQLYPATATAVAIDTKNLKARESGLLYMPHQRSIFLHVSLSTFLLP